MAFSKEMMDIKIFLEKNGQEAIVSRNAEKYANGELVTESGKESAENKIKFNLLKDYFEKIENASMS